MADMSPMGIGRLILMYRHSSITFTKPDSLSCLNSLQTQHFTQVLVEAS